MASDFSLLDPLAKINQMQNKIDLMWAGYNYRKAQRELEARGDTKTQQANNSQMWDMFKGGVWGDYSKGDAVTKVQARDKDGNPKYDKNGNPVMKNEYHAGAITQNILGNTARYGAIAMSFMKDKETANNSLNDYATQFRKQGQSTLMNSGNPYLMAAGALSMLSDKVGGTASASKTGNFWTDAGNTVASFVPFLGFAGKNAGKFNELADVNASSYSNIGDVYGAREHSGGSFVFGGANIKNKIEDSNRKAFTISNDILQPAKRDMASAMNSRWGVSAEFDLNGGMNRVNNFGVNVAKQGAILQFTKRTLSKHKIKKQQDGGKIQQGRTLDELVDYVEQQNPPFWKRMSGQDRNYVANDDGSVSSLRMTYSEGKEEPYADVYPLVQYDLNGNLKYYFDPNEAYTMAKLRNDVVRMSREEAKRFTEGYKDSTKLKSYYRNYHPTQVKLPKEAWSWEYKTLGGSIPENEEIIEEFKEGGKVNVIPDGALHKNKHHLEEVDEKFEDVTNKGIPVIVESEDGEVIQQAEVEREEIIFRLEVTKKLEELSKKHTDEAAIEAGKLLVKEILYNTEDNTGKMI